VVLAQCRVGVNGERHGIGGGSQWLAARLNDARTSASTFSTRRAACRPALSRGHGVPSPAAFSLSLSLSFSLSLSLSLTCVLLSRRGIIPGDDEVENAGRTGRRACERGFAGVRLSSVETFALRVRGRELLVRKISEEDSRSDAYASFS